MDRSLKISIYFELTKLIDKDLSLNEKKIEAKTANIIATLEAILGSIGIIIAWIYSNQDSLSKGVFESLSAGNQIKVINSDPA